MKKLLSGNEAIAQGEFREDLFYRLNVVNLRVPPLRERKEDLVPLTQHFIGRFAAEIKKDVRGIDPGAVMESLVRDLTAPGGGSSVERR